MGTVTVFTAARMQEIEDAAIIDGEIISGDLILTRHDGTTINAGPVYSVGSVPFIGQYTTATRPAAAGNTGKILWDTDLAGFYKSNGTTWVLQDYVVQSELDAVPEIAAGTGLDIATVGAVTTVSIEPAFNNLAIAQYINAVADQTVTNTTTLASDTELILPVAASAFYEVTAHIFYEADAAADFRIGWSGPASSTLQWGVSGLGSAATGGAFDIDRNLRAIGATGIVGGIGIGSPLICRVDGILSTGVTSGFLQFRFAQGTANAIGSVRKAGSLLKLRRLN